MSLPHISGRRWPALLAVTLAFPLALWACAEQQPDDQASQPAADAPTVAPRVEPGPAAAADPAAYRGAAIAGQVCAQCHQVGDTKPTISIPGAVPFTDVARRPETTPESLAAWLRTSHPSMPNYIFGEGETADIVAYIMSLRTSQ
jgi:mono/diheme cytochrome c family protein